jgi:hypothetical protein
MQFKKNILLFIALFFIPFFIQAQEVSVSGPDQKLIVNIGLDKGVPYYTVSYAGKQMLEKSPLGLRTNLCDFTNELHYESYATRMVEDIYQMPMAKVSQVHYKANELTYTLTKKEDTLRIVFRVSNNDIAFSYQLSAAGDAKNVIITSEASGFDFPSFTTTFITPQSTPQIGWHRTKPSYEEEYTREEPIGTASKFHQGYTFPALFHVGHNGWALLSETGTDSHYAGTHLSDGTQDGLYTIAFPQSAENGGIGDTTSTCILPMQTPWRTITVGDNLTPIVETTIAWDVVKPRYKASQTYIPGKATWSWILWQDESCNYQDQVTFIDLAAKMHFNYILIDALWDKQIGYENMPRLIQYAHSRGIDVFLWYNSNGYWNDAPQGPRGKMDSAPARQAEMQWMKDLGVKGIKVDFFGGDKQETMKLYEDILTDANRYGLMVIFHGTTIPRGWQRMYPNFVSSEAVLASENLIFNQHYADTEASCTTILPYTRNTVAAMDFGGVFFNKRFSKYPEKSGNIRRTTDALELATSVLYESPIQNIAIAPNNIEEQPQYVLDFVTNVPTIWDETKYIAGYPNKDVVLARRHGNTWYVAAANGEKIEKKMKIYLPMLKNQTVTLYYDKVDRTIGMKNVKINKDGMIQLQLLSEGGAVIVSDKL